LFSLPTALESLSVQTLQKLAFYRKLLTEVIMCFDKGHTTSLNSRGLAVMNAETFIGMSSYPDPSFKLVKIGSPFASLLYQISSIEPNIQHSPTRPKYLMVPVSDCYLAAKFDIAEKFASVCLRSLGALRNMLSGSEPCHNFQLGYCHQSTGVKCPKSHKPVTKETTSHRLSVLSHQIAIASELQMFYMRYRQFIPTEHATNILPTVRKLKENLFR
jgi:hypothetical protein